MATHDDKDIDVALSVFRMLIDEGVLHGERQ